MGTPGNALDANSINNGFRGGASTADSLYLTQATSSYSMEYSPGKRSRSGSPYGSNYGGPYGGGVRGSRIYNYDDGRQPFRLPFADDRYQDDNTYFDAQPPPFDTRPGRQSRYCGSSSLDGPPPYWQSLYNSPLDQPQAIQNDAQRSMRRANTSGIRPLALPQIEYSEGAPFLRAYSDDLNRYGITEDLFVRIIDKINVAIIPNPENQIFQKAAGIAGFFVPGAIPAAALMGSQIVAGVGAYVGYMTILGKTLSRANSDVFLPVGLEICIVKQAEVAQTAGLSYAPSIPYHSRPEEKVASFGKSLAPLAAVYPPDNSQGRQDPLAKLGHHFVEKKGAKKVGKADKELAKIDKERAKGKLKEKDRVKAEEKMRKLDDGLLWLMVRKASPKAIEAWKQTSRESKEAITQAQQE